MKAHNEIEEQLWNYIDGSIPDAEKSVIEELIRSDAAWRAKYSELLDVHQLLQSDEWEEPSLRFTKNVMETISRTQIAPAAKKYINNKIIWGLGFFFITMLVLVLVYTFSSVFSGNQPSSGPGRISQELDKLNPGFSINGIVLNLFIFANVVIGLFLLDAVFTSRKKALREKAGF